MPKSLMIRGLFFAVSLVALLICFNAGAKAVEWFALRPLALQLGTKASYHALTTHVTTLLHDQKGATREQVHKALNELGGQTSFLPNPIFIYEDGRMQESVTWDMVELPFGFHFWAMWDLYYNSGGKLIQATLFDP